MVGEREMGRAAVMLPYVGHQIVNLDFQITSAELFLALRYEYTLCTCSFSVGIQQVPFSMAIGNEELMHECAPKHLRMGTARLKLSKATDEEGWMRGVSI